MLLVGDSVYMLQLAAGTYVDGGLLDASWTIVCACLGLASGSRAAERRTARTDRVAVAIPVLFSLAGTVVLYAGATGGGHQPVVVALLGMTAVLLACTRLLLTLRTRSAWRRRGGRLVRTS